MFGRFFKNKEEPSKSLPPGHRPSQHAEASGGAPPVDGGFFNIQPPMAAKPPSAYPSSSPGQMGGSNAPRPGGQGFQGGRPGGSHHGGGAYGHAAQQQQPPHYGQPPQPPAYGSQQPPVYANQHAPPAPGGGMDMFGGMSIKAPQAPAPTGYGGASQPLKPSPIKHGAYNAPPTSMHHEPAPASAASGGLFSGLDFAPATTAPAPAIGGYNPDEPITRPVLSDRKSSAGSGRGSTFNYLDVAASAGSDAPPMHRSSVGPGTIAGSRTMSTKTTVKKKKTKSFRPGFGRQLSDESIAALQRGDLNEEELMQQQQQHAPIEEPPAPKIATNPTDLAHLLPPVKSGSVLAGLTVHDASSSASSSSGSVLAGLAMHATNAPSPRGSASPPTSASEGGILAGLSVHGKSASEVDASTSVVLPSAKGKTKKDHAPTEPEKPAAPPTPEERLINTLRDFHASAINFRTNALKQNDEENRILERKIQLAKQLTQYEIDLKTIEAQQQQACELEDFEKADALNSTINSVRHCITLSESDVRKVDSELAAFVKAKEKAFTNQLRSTRGTLKELEKFREDQDAERTALREVLKKYEVERSEHLQFEGERIETELSHVSSNLDHLASEKSEIEGTIEEQCKNEIQLREELLVEKAGVEDEIRELERQLQLKIQQRDVIQTSINKAEKDIDVVRSKYSRQLKRIADREAGLEKTKMEVEADAEQLMEEKKQFTENIRDYESKIAGFGKRMSAVKKEMRAARLLAAVLEVQETRREQGIVRKKQHTAELTALADSAAIAEQSFVMLRKQHEDLEKSLAIHQNAIASAAAMIPKLDEEKKAAAAQRNFKEAARISKDIKSLEKDQATAEEMVEVVEMELQDLKERIAKRESEYEEKKEELKAVEKQLELNTLQELWKEAKHLRKALRKFEQIKNESIAAADGVDFRSSAILLVQAEFDACILQAEALKKKHDVTDPHADEDEEDSDDTEDEVSEDNDDHAPRATEIGVSASAAVAVNATEVVENGDASLDDGPGALGVIAVKITELESAIEAATENEDYELAARLDEKLETLRLRRQSLQAISSYQATEKPVAVREAVQEVDDHQEGAGDDDEEGQSLEEELEVVRTRIKMLEADLDHATENDYFDGAAMIDEELQQLHDEEEQILELVEESRPAAPATEPVDVLEPVAQQEGQAPSMFEGLGFKQPAEAPEVSSSPLDMSGGLEVKAETEEQTSIIETHTPNAEPTPVSPREAPASPRRLSVGSGPNSPRRKSSIGMLSGLQLSVTDSPQGSPRAAIAAESPRRASDVAVEEVTGSATDDMFSGLQVGSTPAEAPAAVVVETESSSLFGGLMVTSTTTTTTTTSAEVTVDEDVTSDDGVFVDSHEGFESTASPTAPGEDSVFSGLSVAQHTVTETTTTTSSSSSDLFGGLSFDAPASEDAQE